MKYYNAHNIIHGVTAVTNHDVDNLQEYCTFSQSLKNVTRVNENEINGFLGRLCAQIS